MVLVFVGKPLATAVLCTFLWVVPKISLTLGKQVFLVIYFAPFPMKLGVHYDWNTALVCYLNFVFP